jgi:hypothetical protein
MKKILAVGIILLFIGVAVAPSINTCAIKATTDDDLVEVTIQICGINGYKDTTVTLTKEHYTEVERVFDDLETKLTTMKTRDEAIPVYKDVIRKLSTYGLLPKGISVEQAQKLIIGGYSKTQELSISEKSFVKNSAQEYCNKYFCLVAGAVQDGRAMGILSMIGLIFLLLSIFPLSFILILYYVVS